MIQFDPYRYDPESRILYRDDEEILLPPRVLAVLESLLKRPGKVVPKEDLLASAWDGAFVGEDSLTQAISQLRQALDDDPQHPTYIQTITRRGYRFIAEVSRPLEREPAAESRSGAHPEAPSDSDAPSSPTSADAALGEGEPLEPGCRLGRYEILDRAGTGAMGEVWRARDHELDRDVALKLVPSDLANDPKAMERFRREARMLAAVDHPNVATIHTVEEWNGTRFIVMELVEGRTLRDVLEDGPLPIDEALGCALQIARGLEVAHARGIVHRDLKPGNVALTDDGQVKLLDFGLAKEVDPGERDASADPTSLTRSGAVIGTAPYMSPEQAEGKPLDHRTDIFSLGVLLYEMATGQRPFRGETRVAIVSSILKDTPEAVTDLNPRLPRHLGRILRLALEKDPERRIQTAKDLRNQLSELRREVESGARGAASSPAGARLAGRRWAWGALALVAIATVVGLIYFEEPEGLSTVPSARPLTAFTGHESEPALSPDGTRVAFTWDGGDERGVAQLYVQLIDGDSPLPLTEGPAGALSPTWSPDGTRIAFLRALEEDEGRLDVVVVAALSGNPRPIGTVVSPAGYGLSWSPDGTELAVVHRESSEHPDAIFLLSTDGSEQMRRLTSPPPGIRGDTMPAFSPDGTSVAFSRVRLVGWRYADVYVQGVDEDEPDRITFEDERVYGLDWIPDGRGLVVSSGPGGSHRDRGVYRVAPSAREPLRIGENMGRVTTARTAPRLVYTRRLDESNIWRASGPAFDQREVPSPFIASTRRDAAPQYSPDGSRIAIVSDRTGTYGIWICDAATGRACTLVTTSLRPTGQPRWSPGGERIAYYGETEEGNPDIHVIRADGSSRRRLTDHRSRDGTPWWSRDGEWIYFTSARSGSPQIWKLPAAGGQPRQITEDGGVMPFEAADGEYVYYSKALGQSAIWRVPADGGEETLVLDEKVNFQSWSVWRDKLVFLLAGTIFSRDLDTGETEELATPGSDVTGFVGLAISPDGRQVLYSQGRTGSDLMIMDDVR